MTWDSQGDAFDAARSLSSGLFNAAGVQVKGICGSSFTTDVIRVERNGIENAVKILTPGATQDPDIVSRFLRNAHYNKTLNDFTTMRISDIVETGPRPYYVMERVAESSLLEIIRLHAPIDPFWLANLIYPVAKSLDTIHQRNVLHANIKPSNLLVVVENGQEKMLLVDFIEPSLAATSATITGAGIYAAPEFRMGTPVSNRSDVYSLGSIVYESLSGSVPNGPRRNPDGTFHVWRNFDRPIDLNILNPEIPKAVSDVVMSSLSPQAISRPATASVMVEEMLRNLEQPRTRVRVDPVVEEHTPVPMLLIVVGVFLVSLLLLFGGFRLFGAMFGGDDNPDFPTPTTAAITTTPASEFTPAEIELFARVPADHNRCGADRSESTERLFPAAMATLVCESDEVGRVVYSSFDNNEDLINSFNGYVTFLNTEAGSGDESFPSTPKDDPVPCKANPNEAGRWESGVLRGSYVCASEPFPRMVWYEQNSFVIGVVETQNGNITDLVQWWNDEAGPA